MGQTGVDDESSDSPLCVSCASLARGQFEQYVLYRYEGGLDSFGFAGKIPSTSRFAKNCFSQRPTRELRSTPERGGSRGCFPPYRGWLKYPSGLQTCCLPCQARMAPTLAVNLHERVFDTTNYVSCDINLTYYYAFYSLSS